VQCDFGVPAAFGGVVAEGGDVSEVGLELDDELGGGQVVAALLADVGGVTEGRRWTGEEFPPWAVRRQQRP